jgi:hypothetical protein
MATAAENIQTRIDNIAAELAAMDATQAGGLPDFTSAEYVKHVEYRMSLVNELSELQAILPTLGGSWEVTSEFIA